MEKGFWCLSENTYWYFKKWKNKDGKYLLWKDIEGPFYLISEEVLTLISDLEEPKTTEMVYMGAQKYHIEKGKIVDCLTSLETLGIIMYTDKGERRDKRLIDFTFSGGQFVRDLPGPFKFLIVGFTSIVFVHLIYLFLFNFRLLLGVSRTPTLMDYLIVLLISFASTILHELFHLLSSYLLTKKVPPIKLGRMGILFPFPVPRVNLNITYLIDKPSVRLLILTSGLFADLLFLWFSFQMVIYTSQIPIWVYASWLILFSFVLNLLPLWNSDGYYILSDLLSTPNLAFYARESLKNLLKRKGDYHLGLAIYGGVKLIFEFGLFIVFLGFLYKLSCSAGIIGQYIFWIIFVIIFIMKLIKGMLKHRRRNGLY